MKCVKCFHENPAGCRFCQECGARQEIRCGSCDSIVLDSNSIFCGECGGKLSGQKGSVATLDLHPVKVAQGSKTITGKVTRLENSEYGDREAPSQQGQKYNSNSNTINIKLHPDIYGNRRDEVDEYSYSNVISQTVAGYWCFFLGGLGAHRFYLGKHLSGFLYLLFCFTSIPALIAIIEFFIIAFTDQRSWAWKYNRGKLSPPAHWTLKALCFLMVVPFAILLYLFVWVLSLAPEGYWA